MTTPVPLASRGLCLVQGRRMSGYRSVAEILTTDSRIRFSRVLSAAWSAEAITGDARPTLTTINSDIRVRLGIFIAGTRMRLPIRVQPGRRASGHSSSRSPVSLKTAEPPYDSSEHARRSS